MFTQFAINVYLHVFKQKMNCSLRDDKIILNIIQMLCTVQQDFKEAYFQRWCDPSLWSIFSLCLSSLKLSLFQLRLNNKYSLVHLIVRICSHCSIDIRILKTNYELLRYHRAVFFTAIHSSVQHVQYNVCCNILIEYLDIYNHAIHLYSIYM